MSASAGRIMMIPKGDYDVTVTYRILDIVSYNGSSYVAKRTTVGNVPTDTNYWQPVADMSAKMDRSVYDSNNNGIVDNAEKVNDHTVEKDVPADAQFTDTKTLSGMTDTDINNPTEGQTLRYNATTKKFENGTVASTFNSLTDTNFVDLRDGQVAMYDSETSKWINADVEGIVPIVTWADGTDDQIAKMLEAHYQGLIDIHDYWAVGDERVVHLDAIPATSDMSAIAEQDIVLVLVNAGGKTLSSPINDVSECAFVIGQKDCFSNNVIWNPYKRGQDYPADSYEYQNMYEYDLSALNGWNGSLIKSWLNSSFRNALPASIKSIFKQHINKTAANKSSDYTWSGGAYVRSTASYDNSTDYFSLPAEKEVFGSNAYSTANDDTNATNATIEGNLTQFTYYQTQANRTKSARWWTRTTNFLNSVIYVSTSGSAGNMRAEDYSGILAHGVI